MMLTDKGSKKIGIQVLVKKPFFRVESSLDSALGKDMWK